MPRLPGGGHRDYFVWLPSMVEARTKPPIWRKSVPSRVVIPSVLIRAFWAAGVAR